MAQVGTGNFSESPANNLGTLFSSLGFGPAQLKPAGGNTLSAQASDGAPASSFPPDGTPIAAAGEGASVEAIVKFPTDAPVAVPSFASGVPRPAIWLALAVGAYLALYKVLK